MTEDERIAALFAAPERAPDEAFVARVARAVDAERRMAAARVALWRRFGIEIVASAAVIAAFYLLWRLSPALTLEQLPVAPSAAAILVLFLWFGAELRPFAMER
ncbi:MAG: hypothetical protein QOJ53_1957 [Sphingomonadales bacterium]|jgi:hypothetical protein|nr:hypothetical protein [Sphingomonadales bacterium]MEA3047625.1 hypothetical protein [Sphingomonadales bacterium]